MSRYRVIKHAWSKGLVSLLAFAAALCGTAYGDGVSSRTLEQYLNEQRLNRVHCGPISGWFCLRLLGHDVSQDDLDRRCGQSERGTALDRVVAALKEYEPTTTFYESPTKSIDSLTFPAIMVYSDHCVVCVKPTADSSELWMVEPTTGAIGKEPRDAVIRKWSGKVVTFEQPSSTWLRWFVASMCVLTACVSLATLYTSFGKSASRVARTPTDSMQAATSS